MNMQILEQAHIGLENFLFSPMGAVASVLFAVALLLSMGIWFWAMRGVLSQLDALRDRVSKQQQRIAYLEANLNILPE